MSNIKEDKNMQGLDESEMTEEAKRTVEAFRDFTSDDDITDVKMSVRTLMGGDVLVSLRRRALLIVIIVVFFILYISSGYNAQQEMIEINNLHDTLNDIKYDALNISSELMEKTRQSKIEEYLRANHDTSLQRTSIPPYTILIDE